MESKIKGTMILRCDGYFYKVHKLRSNGDNNYIFEYKDLDPKENKILRFSMFALFSRRFRETTEKSK